MNPYTHPARLNQIGGQNNSFLQHMPNFTRRRLLPEFSKKAQEKNPYRDNSQPDFN